MSSPSERDEVPPKTKQEKKRAILKVILFITRVQRVTRFRKRDSTKRCTIDSRDSNDCELSPLYSPNGSHLDQTGLGIGLGLPRCRTVGNFNLVVKQRAASRHSNIYDYENEGRNSPGASLGHSCPSCRSRSSSEASRRSLSPTVSSRPILRSEDDSNNRGPRFLNYTSMMRPYSVTYCRDYDPNKEKPLKTINIIHNKTFASSKAQASKLGSKIARRLSSRDPSSSSVVRFSASDKPKTTEDHPTLRREHNVLMSLGSQEAEEHIGSYQKCTSEENLTACGTVSGQRLSASPTMRRKSSVDLLDVAATIAASQRANSNTSSASLMTSKHDKKKAEKLKQNQRNLHELFTAVEQDDIGKVRSMLERGGVDIRGENLDDLTLLDVAIMLNHNEVALLLLKHGAQENPRLSIAATRLKHLQALIDVASTKLAELEIAAKRANPPSKDIDKQLSTSESRLHMLKKMKTNFENSTAPSPPRNVTLHVSSSNSLLVQFDKSEQSRTVVTRYKVEWSSGPDFSQLEGSQVICDLRRLEVTISNLNDGEAYFVRVAAGNFKGFSDPVLSQPECATPSSWRQVNGKQCRTSGKLCSINNLFYEVKDFQQSNKWEKKLLNADSPHKRKRPSLRNLFLTNKKFHKNPKKGVYLASILYKDDKILCTVDDCLPVVDVDENVPVEPQLSSDINWLIKVSCAWEDLKSMTIDSESVNASPTLSFRMKLLEAASNMQTALGVVDLGRLHHVPVVDANGVTLLVTIQYVHDPKTVHGLAVRWTPLSKFSRKQFASLPEPGQFGVVDFLTSNLLDYLNFHESTALPLDRGLYLCYLKLQSTMSQISVLVPENLPAVLPFTYIRDNPHVSKEEWDWLRTLDGTDISEIPHSAAQSAFHWSLTSAAKILLDDLEVDEEDVKTHRIFRLEVVEIHPDVSFLLLVPCHDDVCTAPGQQPLSAAADNEKRGCLWLPLHIFEFANLCTYHPEFIALYCRLSALLDINLLAAEQLRRQAFSSTEIVERTDFVDRLRSFQQRLDEIWRPMRWVQDITLALRERNTRCGLPLSALFTHQSASNPVAINRAAIDNPCVVAAVAENGPETGLTRLNGLLNSPGAPIDDLMTPTGSLPKFSPARGIAAAAPGPSPPSAAQSRRHSQGSEEEPNDTEDNSDVGYHSDQSIDKMGAISLANGAPPPDGHSQSLLATVLKRPIAGGEFGVGLFENHRVFSHGFLSATASASSPSVPPSPPAPPKSAPLPGPGQPQRFALPRSYVNLPPPPPIPTDGSFRLESSEEPSAKKEVVVRSLSGRGCVGGPGSPSLVHHSRVGSSFLNSAPQPRRYHISSEETGQFKAHILLSATRSSGIGGVCTQPGSSTESQAMLPTLNVSFPLLQRSAANSSCNSLSSISNSNLNSTSNFASNSNFAPAAFHPQYLRQVSATATTLATSQQHEYVNYTSDASSSSDLESSSSISSNHVRPTSREHNVVCNLIGHQQRPGSLSGVGTAPRPSSITSTGGLSDSELNERRFFAMNDNLRRRADPLAAHEDLSSIDQVFAQAKRAPSSRGVPTPSGGHLDTTNVSPTPGSRTSTPCCGGGTVSSSPGCSSVGGVASCSLSCGRCSSAASVSQQKCSSIAASSVASSPQPGIIRVYAAYETGLAKGTSVRLHITPRTTSKEVVDLVVRQLNKAAEAKGLSSPFYSDDELELFCLAAVIGARERCLRDDYRPLDLQNPWRQGKLLVRKRSDVLAALDFCHGASV